MNPERRGKLTVITVISLSLALQFTGSLISLGWGSDPDLDALLHEHFGISVRQPASATAVAVDVVIVVILCWGLYAGYRLARWTLVLLYAGPLAVLAWVSFAVGLPPLSADRWSGFFVLIIAALVLCLLGLLSPSTGAFQRWQRGVPSHAGRSAA